MKSFAVIVATLLPLVLAAPASSEALEKRTAGNIYMCNGEGWTNNCKNQFYPLGQCLQIADEYLFSVGSAGPDAGAICRFFDSSHSTCTGSGLAILTKPGSSTMYHDSGNPGGNVKYVRCQECTNCT